MKAVYDIALKLTIVHDIDEVNEDFKNADELATDICHMICDEAVMCNAVASYDVERSVVKFV